MAQDKLSEEGITLIKGWVRLGLTEEQVAKNMGIAYSTFNVWKNKYSELSEALKKAGAVVNFEIEGKLYDRAYGYMYEETKTYIEETDGIRKIKKEIHTKHMPPDVTAQIFWLKNRMPDRWKNKVEFQDNSQLDKLDMMLEEIKKDANS